MRPNPLRSLLLLGTLCALAVSLLAGPASAAGHAAARGASPDVISRNDAALSASVPQAISASPSASMAGSMALPPIKHVFIIINENKSATTTFPDSGPPPAPYLGTTLRAEGAFVPNYYGIGHNSEDNYAAMISGQSPNPDTSGDCQQYGNFPAPVTSGAPYYQEEGAGCIYPADIQTIADQLTASGHTWKDYNQDMGNAPSRESATCGHPAVGATDNTQSQVDGDAYATRHNPFVYFHSIIDNQSLCASHVVNLNELATDLKSAVTTPNYVFITPNLCEDGHDATCMTPGEKGDYAGVNEFLAKWAPLIMNSPAYKDENGLLITTWDESTPQDTGACCGEMAGPSDPLPGITGAGGGRVGAVLDSPCIKPGTVTQVAYNQYSQLGSIENLFGLKHIGYAQLPGEAYFGSDIFTNPSCGALAPPPTDALAPKADLRLGTPTASGRSLVVPVTVSSNAPGATYTVSVRRIRGAVADPFRTLTTDSASGSVRFAGTPGATYQFRAVASGAGKASAPVYRSVTLVTTALPPGAHLNGPWRRVRVTGAPTEPSLVGRPGAGFRYAYEGSGLAVIGIRAPSGGLLSVTFDGVTRTISVHADRRLPETAVFIHSAAIGHHTLTVKVRSGSFTLEGLRIRDLA